MQLPKATEVSRRQASLLFSSLLSVGTTTTLSPTALADSDAVRDTPGPPPEALGGLKPGTGRSLNALIKMRSITGVQRTGTVPEPLFKPGQILDEMKTAEGGAAQITFSFPEAWTLAGGPNLDVRDVRTGDSAFLLAAPLPSGTCFETLQDDYFLTMLFAPEGKCFICTCL